MEIGDSVEMLRCEGRLFDYAEIARGGPLSPVRPAGTCTGPAQGLCPVLRNRLPRTAVDVRGDLTLARLRHDPART
ncbi:hypothetical protein I5Q34_31620 [Streptomyces sp. AV19]|uniref:hypothetical protein n=1 Tax=Streptomyces sp. AV19 TaxID=2793068 RepID=UPI0018FE9103|nr:hypothetical protein [Streptomyces sp. AV19]MBH1938759.1 hypothetical protein [Streptomyces sp. AV19]MDG4533966.1 hypothetical protein [Streptomyces sp. AV19]